MACLCRRSYRSEPAAGWADAGGVRGARDSSRGLGFEVGNDRLPGSWTPRNGSQRASYEKLSASPNDDWDRRAMRACREEEEREAMWACRAEEVRACWTSGTQRFFSGALVVIMALVMAYLVVALATPMAKPRDRSRSLIQGTGPIAPPEEEPEHFNCQVGYFDWHRAWSPRKQAWCCKKYDRACPTTVTTTSELYNCRLGYAVWETTWPRAKRRWCCENFFPLGCHTTTLAAEAQRAQTLPPPQRVAPPLAAYDCWASSAEQRHTWSEETRASCCEKAHISCPVARALLLKPTAVATTTSTLPYDCTTGLRHWIVGWSASKQAWCCLHESRGCPATGGQVAALPSPARPLVAEGDPCGTACMVDDISTTCGARVRWTAHFEFAEKANACSLAHKRMLAECPDCVVCTLTPTLCATWAAHG